MMSYITLISLLLISIGLLMENLVKGGPLRIVNYTGKQYFYGILTGAINSLALFFKIVAYQNERSGLITLMQYVGLVYAFIGDYLIFNERLSAFEIVGILIILLLNIALVVQNMRLKKTAAA